MSEKMKWLKKLVTLWEEQAVLYNINHLHYTDYRKRKDAVEKIPEGFAESGLINLTSADTLIM